MAKKRTAVSEWMRQIGQTGGRARAAALTPEERSESARNAIKARWAKFKAQQNGADSTPAALSNGRPGAKPTDQLKKKGK